jgi:hypothetical protein
MSLSVLKKGGWNAPPSDGIMPVPNLIGRWCISFDPAWVEAMEMKRTSVSKVMAPAKRESVKQPE